MGSAGCFVQLAGISDVRSANVCIQFPTLSGGWEAFAHSASKRSLPVIGGCRRRRRRQRMDRTDQPAQLIVMVAET